jgi:hypothetical protein
MQNHASPTLGFGLALFFAVGLVLNLGYAAYFWFISKNVKQVAIWGVVAGVFLIHVIVFLAAGFAHSTGPMMPRALADGIDAFMGPITYTTLSVIGFTLLLWFRRFFTLPAVAWAGLNLSLLAGGWFMTNPDFRSIMVKEDNVPITMLIYSVGFFTWLALRRAVLNDERIAKGQPVMEKADGEDEKVLVWPDLVYTELVAMILCTVVLIVWAILLKAPLEQPATAAKAPNPSKAPWYFLGLQEMLVYFDPWMAGVVLPSMIVVGLIAIPYIDFNPKGNGYFTFVERRFAVIMFLFGFLVLWVTLIVLGTILRGPNWNFFAPFEYWDPHKVLPLNNVNLSTYFWSWFGRDAATMKWWTREIPGFVVIFAYLFLLPPLMARLMKGFFLRMGFLRFFLLVNLLQFMAALPIKMILRWTINLKYIVYIPEYFFNI